MMVQGYGRPAALAMVVGAMFVFTEAAHASTVYVTTGNALAVVANPGEKNYVTVNDTNMEVKDTAGITAGAGCEQIDATTAWCKGWNPPGVGETLIDLGDGDDFYHEQSNLYKDDVDAGPGNDEVYVARETDTVRGGDGNDIIKGGPGADKLDGGAGNDTVTGGDEDDTIFGGTGQDILSGDGEGLSYNGNDTISAEDGEFDRVSCDGGADYVTADEADSVNVSCDEVKRVAGGTVEEPPPGGDGAPVVTVKLPARPKLASFLSSGFSFSATLSEPVSFAAVLYVPAAAARKLGLGRKDTRIAQGGGTAGPGTAAAKLTKRFKTSRLKALLRAGGAPIPVIFQALAQDADGNAAEVVRRFKLRR